MNPAKWKTEQQGGVKEHTHAALKSKGPQEPSLLKGAMSRQKPPQKSQQEDELKIIKQRS